MHAGARQRPGARRPIPTCRGAPGNLLEITATNGNGACTPLAARLVHVLGAFLLVFGYAVTGADDAGEVRAGGL